MEIQLMGKVIGSLESNTLDILIGVEQGMLDGGHVRRIHYQTIPTHLRMPNTKFWVYLNEGGIVKIEEFEA